MTAIDEAISRSQEAHAALLVAGKQLAELQADVERLEAELAAARVPAPAPTDWPADGEIVVDRGNDQILTVRTVAGLVHAFDRRSGAYVAFTNKAYVSPKAFWTIYRRPSAEEARP